MQKLIVFVLSLLILGCPWQKKGEPEIKPTVSLRLPQKKLQVSSSSQRELQVLMQGLSDLDAIYRELIRVALEQKTSSASLFYKLQRSLAAEEGIRVSPLSSLGCEKYRIHFSPQKSNWKTLEVLETCLKVPVVLMKVDLKKENQYDIQIFSEPLQKLLGLRASLAFQMAQCHLRMDSGRLVQARCEKLSHEKPHSEHVLLIQSLTLEQKNEEFEAHLMGQMLDNLAPLRKFELHVPVQGAITIQETDLYPAEVDLVPHQKTTVQSGPLDPLKNKEENSTLNSQVESSVESKKQPQQQWTSGEPDPDSGELSGDDQASDDPESQDPEVQTDESNEQEAEAPQEFQPQEPVIGSPEIIPPPQVQQ